MDSYREKLANGEKLDKDQKVWYAVCLIVKTTVCMCVCDNEAAVRTAMPHVLGIFILVK